MAQRKKDKLRTQRWEWYVDDTIQSLLNGIVSLLAGIPEYEGSFKAIQGGLDYRNIYRTGNAIKTVGSELAVTHMSFKAITDIEVISPDVYLIDPYTRGVYAENGLAISHTGLKGDAILLTTIDEPIEIESAELEGFINTSTLGAIEINGTPDIDGIYAPSAWSVVAKDCPNLESIVAPNAVYIDLSGCALTAQAIEDLFVSIELANKEDGTIIITGGTNAEFSTWSTAAQNALQNILTFMQGWTASYNGQL
jgi:hypothetical protein